MPAVALARHLMGTRFEIVLGGAADLPHLRAAGEEALDEIERLERQLSFYRPDSELSAVNARAGREWVRVEPRLFRLLQRARRLSEATGGAFDPTVAPLLRAWGFVGGRGQWPDEREAEEARRLVGPERVLLDEEALSVRFDRPGVALDLGAIGKGYAVECAATLLRENGIASALLHGGTSTLTAIGVPEGGDAWTIAVADPARPDCLLATVGLSDGQSLSVSGVHGKSFVGPDGRAYGHVLDPRQGRPVQGARLAAIVTSSATETDALSTALLVRGAEGPDLLACGWPSAGALIVTEDGSLRVRGSDFLLSRP